MLDGDWSSDVCSSDLWDAMQKDKHRPWDGKKGKHEGKETPEKEGAGEPAPTDKAE
jgi:hypothetical protein